MVFGDITNETTDVIVNTTDFQNFDSGTEMIVGLVWTWCGSIHSIITALYTYTVIHIISTFFITLQCNFKFNHNLHPLAVCKDILMMAGPTVQRNLQSGESLGYMGKSRSQNSTCKMG